MRHGLRLITILVSLVVTVFSLGCGSALRVSQSGKRMEGIPFYAKEAKCLHQEVFVMPYYRLTLQALNGEKIAGSQTATVSAAYYLTDETALELTSMINGTADLSSMTAEQQGDKFSKDWESVKGKGATDIYAKISDDTWPKYMIANSNSPKVYVNYGTVYYLNVKIPFSGSAKADYKLASDGTLTEASAEITNDTFKTVLGALPVADLIKSAAGIGLATKSVGGRTFQLKAESRSLKITKFQTVAFESGCPDQDGFQATPQVGILIEDVGSDSSSSTATNKNEENAITVNGKIVLPKATSANGGTKPAAQSGTDKPSPEPK